MQGSEYQSLAMRTKGDFENFDMQMLASSLGLAGESSEVLKEVLSEFSQILFTWFAASKLSVNAGGVDDNVKKVIFHGHEYDRNKIIKEMGDVLWYLALLCDAIGTNLDVVMFENIEKLRARYANGFSSEDSINRKY